LKTAICRPESAEDRIRGSCSERSAATHSAKPETIEQAFAFIDAANAAKKASLIHCGAGISRSATLAVAYLMRHNRWDMKKALDHTQLRRPPARPNEGFMQALQQYEAKLYPDAPPSMPKQFSALQEFLSGGLPSAAQDQAGVQERGARAVLEILKEGQKVCPHLRS
jgi:hypothetical protein